MRRAVFGMIALLCGVLVPSVTYAQASIAGVAKDTSGAVLPGVTVEVSSPALIEKVRTTTTDGSGAYRVTQLPPGTYTVSFSLTGFNTVKRDGIQLSGNFTATVDADMRVGAVAETITVTGETPVVDTQTTQQQRVLDRDIIRDLPTSRQAYSVATLVPGMIVAGGQQLDVGGSAPPNFPEFSIHGSRRGDTRTLVDGFSVGQRGGGGVDTGTSESMYLMNVGSVQETAITTSGGLGESETAGVLINLVPREGGNTHRGSFYTGFSTGTFQGNNYTDALAAVGLKSANQLDKVWEVTAQEGGPLLSDKLWYYVAGRHQGTRNWIAGMYYNLNAGDITKWTYSPDLNRRGLDDATFRSVSVRLTYQAAPKDKIAIFWDEQNKKAAYLGGGTATQSPEAAALADSRPDRAYSAHWTEVRTNRVLIEAGVGGTTLGWGLGMHPRPDYNTNLIQVTEQAGDIPGLQYRGMTWSNNWLRTTQPRGSISYVTGTHTAKFGFQQTVINYDDRNMNPNPIGYTFNSGKAPILNPNPISFTITAAPTKRLARIDTTGIYAQDSWRLKRWTIQGGVRYDHIHAHFPEQVIAPVRYLPNGITIPETDTSSTHDITPRLAATYDVTGDGKTALKVTLGKYIIAGEGGAWGEQTNPFLRLALSTARSWTDNNHNFVPDCDLLNPAAQSPSTTGSIDNCGPYASQNYAQLLKGNLVYNNNYDANNLTGWGKRAYDWEFSAAVQREVVPRVSVEFGYFRRWYGNQVVTDNLAVGPNDFDHFNYVVPTDPRLPGGGGYTVTLLNVKPTLFGQTNNLITSVNNYGGKTEYWQGVDLSVNARGFKGLTVQGGLSTGRATVDDCNLAAQLPELFQSGQTTSFDAVFGTNQGPLNFCKVQEPFLTQFKGLASYVVPKVDVLLSATWQNFPGPQLAANLNLPNSVAAPLLNRNLAGNSANIPVNLVEAGKQYGDRTSLLDLRFAKVVRLGRTRTNVGIDLYNALNTNTGTGYNQTYISPAQNYLTPTLIVPARFAKFNVQIDF